MTKHNIIHIKLENNEALESRKDVLKTEVDLIKIAQAIRRYRILRLKELELKIELYRKIKDLRNSLKELKGNLPKLQIPRILKKHEEEMHEEEILQKEVKVSRSKEEKKSKEKPKKPTDELESQLSEIQEKLKKLGESNSF